MGKMTPSKEDYLRVLLKEHNSDKVICSKNIAADLNVSKASVSRMMSTFKQCGLIDMEKYGFIKLTKKGRDGAIKIEKRFNIIKSFLKTVLAMNDVDATKEACKMEHAISSETAEKINCLTERLSNQV